MATLDSLPADQRAVIQLVLQRDRTYDDIAEMLSIDRAAVRQRALDAFDALGPGSSVAAPQRALLTDYMLGQLPTRVADQVRGRLAESPADRAWLRVIASELAPLAATPLPEIPAAGGRGPAAEPAADSSSAETAPVPAAAVPAAAAVTGHRPRSNRTSDAAGAQDNRARAGNARNSGGASGLARPSSRRGGAILLGVGAAVVVIVVVVLLLTSSGGSHKNPGSGASTSASTTLPSTSTGTTSTTSTTSTTAKAKLVAQVNLVSPTGAKGTLGVAQVIAEGSTTGVVLVAKGVPANTKSNAYALWLYNSSSDNKLVGFVSQRVGSDGKLETEGPLPPNASHYGKMLVTLETQQKPKGPGQVVLEGPLHLP